MSTPPLAQRVMKSARTFQTTVSSLPSFSRWWSECAEAEKSTVSRIPFSALKNWAFEDDSGNLVHRTGRFFSIQGLNATRNSAPTASWRQPIIHQPEVGILGIITKEFDGVLHFLMQSKMEPGNSNRLQLSPTVQATLSNYSGVHGGRPVAYLDYFTGESHRVIADSCHSEQGAWFYRKRNRNIIVEVSDDVELQGGFHWLTLGQIHRLLDVENLLNTDARSVLSCLPFPFPDAPAAEGAGTLSTWLAEARARHDLSTEDVGLREVGWTVTPDRIKHPSGAFFEIIAADIHSVGREVASWSQPLLRPVGMGLAAFLVRYDADGILHVLARAREEAGAADGLEIGPTVQGMPRNYDFLPAEARPPYMSYVLSAPGKKVLFDNVLSEEGGRFYHAHTRYMLVVAQDDTYDCPPDHQWVSAQGLSVFTQHGRLLNSEARTLITILQKIAITLGSHNDL
ncbi:NDP-hexose 2,3-dehydratase family protein [Streptomyces sp. NPDC051133]|uniref:NDP-hexose 2,3-dehydratase family protein n=1 Tax=Streptomyces sp. NPDC051133 TaxID=3155521 RepID=UPI0034186F62